MQVLVMEHVDGGSMKDYDWSKQPTNVMQDFILQAVFALLDAHVTCGFCHGDFHLDNVLVAKTIREAVVYEDLPGSPRVETHGLLAKLMDFELSKVGTHSTTLCFFRDLQEFFGKSLSNLAPFVTLAPLQECFLRARAWAEDGEKDPYKSLNLVPVIRTLTRVPELFQGGGGAGGYGKKRRPDIRKRNRHAFTRVWP